MAAAGTVDTNPFDEILNIFEGFANS